MNQRWLLLTTWYPGESVETEVIRGWQQVEGRRWVIKEIYEVDVCEGGKARWTVSWSAKESVKDENISVRSKLVVSNI